MTMKGIASTALMWPVRSTASGSSQVSAQACFHKGRHGSEHDFSPEADGQKHDSLVFGRVVGVKLPVPYVSLGPLRFIDQVQLLKKAPSASLVRSD